MRTMALCSHVGFNPGDYGTTSAMILQRRADEDANGRMPEELNDA